MSTVAGPFGVDASDQSDPQWSSMLCQLPVPQVLHEQRSPVVEHALPLARWWSSGPRSAPGGLLCTVVIISWGGIATSPPLFAGGIRLKELRMTCDCMSTREMCGLLSSQFAEP